MSQTPEHPSRRRILALGAAALAIARTSPGWAGVHGAGLDPERLRERAATLPRLHTLIVMQQGETVLEATFRGPPADRPVNIKSVAKTVIATLVGCAIDRGVLEGPDQPITSVLGPLVPASASPRLAEVTIGHLLSMQAGLERTSGANYGSWVTSLNWVQNALDRPFVADPGGPMLYSTGNSHLLSAILTRATGETTHALANAWLGQPLNIRIPPWDRDPQGIFLGGNNMLLSPAAVKRAQGRSGYLPFSGSLPGVDAWPSCRELAERRRKPLRPFVFSDPGATTRTSGSFANSWVRSSESWVRSSIPWVLVGSIVGSIVENRPKCAAIRYISNANGAYSGTVLIPMCRPALHNPRKCAAIRHILRADVPLCDTRPVNS
jgi:CubicO group peptidase (beta-lactamase class C family)